MDYYHTSDSMMFIPACFFIMILVCIVAFWSVGSGVSSLPPVIKHVIVVAPRSNDMTQRC